MEILPEWCLGSGWTSLQCGIPESQHMARSGTLIYPSVASGIKIYSGFENLSCPLGDTDISPCSSSGPVA